MPTARTLAPTPARPIAQQQLIYWPVVLGAAVSSWLVVGLMIGIIWTSGRPVPRQKGMGVVSAPVLMAEEPAAPPSARVAKLPEPPKLAPATVIEAAPSAPAKVVEPAEAPKPAPVPELEAASTAPSRQTHGTEVSFFNNPADAARQALRENKLLFMLHLSGNLEDDCFT